MIVDLSVKGNADGHLLAGMGSLPQGALLIGTVRLKNRYGALVQLKNGCYVQYNAGVIRTLNQKDVEQAIILHETAARG